MARSIGAALAIVGVLVAAAWFQFVLRTGFRNEEDEEICIFSPQPISLKGQTILITGGSTGLGLESAKRLAVTGARIILTARSQAKGEAAVKQVEEYLQENHPEIVKEDSNPPQIGYKILDLDDLHGVQDAAKSWTDVEQIHVLLNNAGVMALPRRELTVDGIERQMQSNHLGHFVLTAKLAPKLVKNARIINVSSGAHEIPRATNGLDFEYAWKAVVDYDPWRSYGTSKLANVLFTRELQRRAQTAGLDWTVSSCHPGTVDTPLWRHVIAGERFAPGTALNVKQGASTQVMLAAHAFEEATRGQYFVNCRSVELESFAKDVNDGERLWKESEELSGVRFGLLAESQ